MGNKKIIFYAFSSQSWDSYFPILVELLKCDPRVKDRISICKTRDKYDFRNEDSKQLFDLFSTHYAGPPVPGAGDADRYPYVLVTTHIPDPKYGLADGFFIFVPHGSGFGNGGVISQRFKLSLYQASNVYCGISPYEHLHIKEQLGSEASQSFSFVATGCPKNDIFAPYIAASMEGRWRLKCKIKQSMGIPIDKTVVFIASHWTSSGLLRKFGTGLIQAISVLGDKIQIIQGSHPNLWDQVHVRAQTSQWIYQSLRREVDRGAVSLSTGVSDATALLASDVVIADMSSIVIEAALLEKHLLLCIDPQLFHDKEVYEIYSGFSVQFSCADDLAHAFLNGVKFPRSREDMMRRNKELFGYNVGCASRKVAQVILDAAEGVET